MQSPCLNLTRILFTLSLSISSLVVDSVSGLLYAQTLDDESGFSFAEENGSRGDDTSEPAPDPSFFDDFSFRGYLENQTAYRYREPRSITKIRNTLFLNAQYTPGPGYQMVFSGWVYHDLAYELFSYETISARFARDDNQPLVFIDNLEQEKDSPVAELRELYLDMYFDKLDVRIGKQFVVWGVLEGIRITDEVNPLDFRELILPDLLNYRIPLWTLRLDYYGDRSNVQFIWIPELKFHEPAPPGSEWELLQDVVDEDGNLITVYPASTLENSEVGIRFSTEWLGADVSLSYLYTWDDFPVIFRSALIDSVVDPIFFPTYTRINIYGATFVKPAGTGVIKGEIAYTPDKYFGLQADTDRDGDGFLDSQGVLQMRHIRWGIGYDINLWGFDLSPAISQWAILDYDDQLIQDEYDTSLTLFARKPIPEYNLVFQLLVIDLLNLDELYLNPEIIFDVTNYFQISTGLDLFFGDQSQLGSPNAGATLVGASAIEQAQFFGNFSHNDRVYMEFRLSF